MSGGVPPTFTPLGPCVGKHLRFRLTSVLVFPFSGKSWETTTIRELRGLMETSVGAKLTDAAKMFLPAFVV